jgi:hypothetical protein
VAGKWISTSGLIFDIFGAALLAWEIYRPFTGLPHQLVVEHNPSRVADDFYIPTSEPPTITTAHKLWEKTKTNRGKLGLGLLIIGFILQIVGFWI